MTPSAQQEGRRSRRHAIGGLLEKVFQENGERREGQTWRALRKGTGSGAVPQHSSFRGLQDNGSWVLTSDRLSPSPSPAQSCFWDGRKS